MSTVAVVVAVVLLVVLLVLTAPIAVALGLATLTAMWIGDVPISLFSSRVYNNFDSFPLLAVPFFILAGDIMRFGTMADRLLAFCRACVGHFIAGLANISVITSLFYGALCGSAAATVAAVGNIMIPAMKKEGYPLPFATAVNSASGVLGIMIPPSVVLILYGAFGNVSIGDLFIASIIPGIAMGAALCVTATLIAFRHGYGIRTPRASWAERGRTAWHAKWAFGVPLIVLGTIYGGVCTPTEAGCLAVCYALFVECFITKSVTWRTMYAILQSSLRTLGMFFFILVIANAFGSLMLYFNLQDVLLSGMRSVTSSSAVFMFIMFLILVALGTVMEGSCILLILTPLLVPMAIGYGVNPIHFGVFMLFCVSIGTLTPPVGACLFVGCSIAKINIMQLAKAIVPFMLAMMIMTLIIAYVPALSLCLVQ